jgi:Protein of unknown function (DUF3311)
MERPISRGRGEGWRQAAINACLLAPCAAVLWVPSYAAETPRLSGLPFLYWYLLAWLLMTPGLMVTAYLLLPRQPKPPEQRG